MSVVFSYKPTDNLKVNSKYGARSGGWHFGIDLGPVTHGVSGDPIYAVADGVVKFVKTGQPHETTGSSYGNYVIIEHTALGFCTLYAHLQKVKTQVGANVPAGYQIATMGNTGHSTGTHLHFELRTVLYKRWSGTRNKTYDIDPYPYLCNASNEPSTQDFAGFTPASTSQMDYDYSYERVTLNQNNVQYGQRLFGRKYRIVIYDSAGKGIDVSMLHIRFSLFKSYMPGNQVSTVTIYNLNVDTEGKIIDSGVRITVEAGYENLFGLIFDGDIIQTIRTRENPDYVLTIRCLDCARLQSVAFSSVEIPRGQNKRQALEAVINDSNIRANKQPNVNSNLQLGTISSGLSSQKYIRGKAVFGMTKDYLSQISSSINGTFYTEDGKINLVQINEIPDGTIVKLDYESGLIDVPQQTGSYVDFRALLNPHIKINGLVNIDNVLIKEAEVSIGTTLAYRLDVDGVYRIMEITYNGDTRGSDWYVSCKSVSQSGAIPAMLADANSLL